MIGRVLAGPALLLGALASPLAAQLKSFPVYAATSTGTGWAAGLDVGTGLNDASGHARYLGARVMGALGPVRLALGGGAWDAGSSTTVQLGSTAAVRLMGGGAPGTLAVFASAGAGRARSGPSDTAATYWSVPFGLAVARVGPVPGHRAVTPWLFPRAQVDWVSFGGTHASQLGVGASGGVSVDLTNRLGVHGAVDWLRLFRWEGPLLTLEGGSRLTVGAGAYLRLSGPS